MILFNILFLTGTPAPDFTLKDVDGKTYSLRDFKGSVVFLDFWASWCPPCRASIPGIIELSREYKDVVILGINLDSDKSKGIKFAKAKNINYPVLLDGFDVAQKYGVRGIPSFVLIDKKGNIVKRWVGFSHSTLDSFKQEIDKIR